MLPFLICVIAALGPASPLLAQHEHPASPYENTQSEEITTLTDEEIAQLRNGEGMGLARPAELNGHPGPRHVLELGEQLGLDEGQRARVTAVRASMSRQAIEKGEDILRAERQLGVLFESGGATKDAVARLTSQLGAMRGELRAIHLNAHIETTRLLTGAQVARYAELRGYAQAGARPLD